MNYQSRNVPVIVIWCHFISIESCMVLFVAMVARTVFYLWIATSGLKKSQLCCSHNMISHQKCWRLYSIFFTCMVASTPILPTYCALPTSWLLKSIALSHYFFVGMVANTQFTHLQWITVLTSGRWENKAVATSWSPQPPDHCRRNMYLEILSSWTSLLTGILLYTHCWGGELGEGFGHHSLWLTAGGICTWIYRLPGSVYWQISCYTLTVRVVNWVGVVM